MVPGYLCAVRVVKVIRVDEMVSVDRLVEVVRAVEVVRVVETIRVNEVIRVVWDQKSHEEEHPDNRHNDHAASDS